MYNKTKSSLALIFSSIFIFSCSGGNMPEEKITFPSIKDVPASSWEKLSNKKIYFGHHSVGANIIDGIKDLMKEDPKIKLNIVKTADQLDFKFGILAHSGVGKNGYPKSKLDGFAKLINDGIGNKADIAFFKFCYVDVRTETEVNNVFTEYKDIMSKLMKDYPEIKFVHVTVPLTTEQTLLQGLIKNPKKTIKRILGKWVSGPPPGNPKRALLNEMIILEYKGKAPIFDLARIESTFLDGTRSSFKKDGTTYYSLAPIFTSDGGHLNKVGRNKVAEQLLILLANLS